MPVTVKIDPTLNSIQAKIIDDATEHNDGVMTAAQVRKLDSLTPGGSGFDHEGREDFSIDGTTAIPIILPAAYSNLLYKVWLSVGRSGVFPGPGQNEMIVSNYFIVSGGVFFIEVSAPFDGFVSWGTRSA
jgi:hypothetical protein